MRPNMLPKLEHSQWNMHSCRKTFWLQSQMQNSCHTVPRQGRQARATGRYHMKSKRLQKRRSQTLQRLRRGTQSCARMSGWAAMGAAASTSQCSRPPGVVCTFLHPLLIGSHSGATGSCINGTHPLAIEGPTAVHKLCRHMRPTWLAPKHAEPRLTIPTGWMLTASQKFVWRCTPHKASPERTA